MAVRKGNRGVWKFVMLLAVSGCGDGTGVPTRATFVIAVGEERFRVQLDSHLATRARRMITGAEQQKIVVGELSRGNGGFNTGYGWHLRPATIAFADASVEVCDGLPSDVEADLDYWVDNIGQYCPWSGRFIEESSPSRAE